VPTSVPACGSTATPTPSNPVDYVAVVDEPGTGAPEVETFTATSEADKAAQIDELEENGTVVTVEPDEPVTALVTPDPRSPEQWGLTNSGFAAAWAAGFDGAGVTIAIVDSGVLATHEDLAGKVAPGIDFYAGSEAAPAGDSNYGRLDPNGHGTHVAGIAAAADNSLGGLGGAPGASILPVRVLGATGSGSTSDVVDGIIWAADPLKGGADVISLSLGGSYCSPSEQEAVEYAEREGAIVVAAAGNDNGNVPIYPAGFEGEVIAVGSTTSANAKSSFSNWGTPFVDIAAPGSLILSTYKDSAGQPANGAYTTLSGTSMATPYVSAVVALVLQHCAAIVNGSAGGSSVADKVLTLLRSTASPSIPGLGARLVQAGAATAAACPS
jgi:subtilisin family serine protease